MGTRGTMAVQIDGQIKSMYNHWDSYPSGLGEDMLAFAKTAKDDELVKQLARGLQPVPEGEPTPEIIERLKPFTDLGVSTGSTSDWYCLLRNTQGDMAKTLQAGYYEPFPIGDEEWSYLVDFDTRQFLVWDGPSKIATFDFDDLPESLKDAGLPEY